MHEFFVSPFADFGFMRRALAGCFALALGAAPLGVFLLLRRMSLTGDAMSHAILPGAAAAYLISGLSLGAMTLGGMIAGMLVALFSGAVSHASVLREDASLATFYLISLASGVLLLSTRGSNLDLLHVLFGSVLALDDASLFLIATSASVSLVLLALFLRPLALECLDAPFLQGVSRFSPCVHLGFLALVVLNLVSAFHALGTLMAVGIMILPAAAARLWTQGLGRLLALAVALALLGCCVGLLVSFHADWPAGASIVLVLGGIQILSLVFAPQGLFFRHFSRHFHVQTYPES
ncbi:MAG: metal ABC transporter permease [Zoogloeaceae bacterium]|nr:metal ABC transporter permease [Zoogloeaceae bacterium]